MIDYLTIQEAVTVALAKRYDGQGNKIVEHAAQLLTA